MSVRSKITKITNSLSYFLWWILSLEYAASALRVLQFTNLPQLNLLSNPWLYNITLNSVGTVLVFILTCVNVAMIWLGILISIDKIKYNYRKLYRIMLALMVVLSLSQVALTITMFCTGNLTVSRQHIPKLVGVVGWVVSCFILAVLSIAFYKPTNINYYNYETSNLLDHNEIIDYDGEYCYRSLTTAFCIITLSTPILYNIFSYIGIFIVSLEVNQKSHALSTATDTMMFLISFIMSFVMSPMERYCGRYEHGFLRPRETVGEILFKVGLCIGILLSQACFVFIMLYS